MHARTVSQKILKSALPWMHKTRLHALQACLLGAMDGRRLSVTDMGRAIDSQAKEKHCIKRADRLLSNPHLQSERQDVYHVMTHLMVGHIQRPVILVDWSDLDPRKEKFLLRAAVALSGRSHTLYEEVHSIKTKEKPATHRSFMKTLKSMLPSSCRPIIVTDGGFKVPWFTLVLQLGWDYVGRVRGRTMQRRNGAGDWDYVKNLYPLASSKPKYLGAHEIARSNPFRCHLVTYKGKAKGRHRLNCAGERSACKHSEVHAEREKEPWLLATSLPVTSTLSKRLVKLYSMRMQIEEAFRDIKSYRYGVGLELSQTRDLQRMQILMMIGMLVTLVLWLLGTLVLINGEAYYYQANTEKRRRVLSVLYLGLRAANDKRIQICPAQLEQAYHKMADLMNEQGCKW